MPQIKEPIYITKNGYGDMVIMGMETYESAMYRLSVYKDVFFHTSNQPDSVFSICCTPAFSGIPPWSNTVTDTGTEELAHMEIVCAIVHQLTKNLTAEELQEQGFAPYYIDHTIGLWPQAASGEPWSASMIQSTGDPLADLHEDMAAEGAAL